MIASAPPPTHPFIKNHVTAPDGTRIAYLAAGVGRPIVMMHGAFTVADEWLAVADQLACSRRVVIVERRERSGDAPSPPLSVEVQDLSAVIAGVTGDETSRARGDVDLFGHSYGATVVTQYAIDTGFRGSLVLYDPASSLAGPLVGNHAVAMRALSGVGRTSVVRTPNPMHSRLRQHAPHWAQMLASLPSPPRKEEALDGFAPTPEDFQRIQGPTTLLLGEHSGPILRSLTAIWVVRQPGVTVLPLRGQGHVGYCEAPGLVADRIEAALKL
ncbi:alpha/beta fold hydrolase [Cystobacter fuscus]|uniref:alpha/beta fold hydrolase n=1 Tax=Cystobacter fuscus TaxID=43 RepID=UPI002B29DC33|nr:alpha/beta hydrolase [Cystobacter fuscus]